VDEHTARRCERGPEDPLGTDSRLVHGGIKHFYGQKYGREIAGPEYPATLDYIIAGVAG